MRKQEASVEGESKKQLGLGSGLLLNDKNGHVRVILKKVPSEFLSCLKDFWLNEDQTEFDETKCMTKGLERVSGDDQLRNQVYTKDEFYDKYCKIDKDKNRWKKAQKVFHGAITNAIGREFLRSTM